MTNFATAVTLLESPQQQAKMNSTNKVTPLASSSDNVSSKNKSLESNKNLGGVSKDGATPSLTTATATASPSTTTTANTPLATTTTTSTSPMVTLKEASNVNEKKRARPQDDPDGVGGVVVDKTTTSDGCLSSPLSPGSSITSIHNNSDMENVANDGDVIRLPPKKRGRIRRRRSAARRFFPRRDSDAAATAAASSSSAVALDAQQDGTLLVVYQPKPPVATVHAPIRATLHHHHQAITADAITPLRRNSSSSSNSNHATTQHVLPPVTAVTAVTRETTVQISNTTAAVAEKKKLLKEQEAAASGGSTPGTMTESVTGATKRWVPPTSSADRNKTSVVEPAPTKSTSTATASAMESLLLSPKPQPSTDAAAAAGASMTSPPAVSRLSFAKNTNGRKLPSSILMYEDDDEEDMASFLMPQKSVVGKSSTQPKTREHPPIPAAPAPLRKPAVSPPVGLPTTQTQPQTQATPTRKPPPPPASAAAAKTTTTTTTATTAKKTAVLKSPKLQTLKSSGSSSAPAVPATAGVQRLGWNPTGGEPPAVAAAATATTASATSTATTTATTASATTTATTTATTAATTTTTSISTVAKVPVDGVAKSTPKPAPAAAAPAPAAAAPAPKKPRPSKPVATATRKLSRRKKPSSRAAAAAEASAAATAAATAKKQQKERAKSAATASGSGANVTAKRKRSTAASKKREKRVKKAAAASKDKKPRGMGTFNTKKHGAIVVTIKDEKDDDTFRIRPLDMQRYPKVVMLVQADGTRKWGPYTDNDVLFGRGNGTASHPGNAKFRAFCWKIREAYQQAYRNEKAQVADVVCDMVANQDPPGRFLEKRGTHYVVAEPRRVIEKTCQALREQKWTKRTDFSSKLNIQIPAALNKKYKSTNRLLGPILATGTTVIPSASSKALAAKKAAAASAQKQQPAFSAKPKAPATKGRSTKVAKRAAAAAKAAATPGDATTKTGTSGSNKQSTNAAVSTESTASAPDVSTKVTDSPATVEAETTEAAAMSKQKPTPDAAVSDAATTTATTTSPAKPSSSTDEAVPMKSGTSSVPVAATTAESAKTSSLSATAAADEDGASNNKLAADSEASTLQPTKIDVAIKAVFNGDERAFVDDVRKHCVDGDMNAKQYSRVRLKQGDSCAKTVLIVTQYLRGRKPSMHIVRWKNLIQPSSSPDSVDGTTPAVLPEAVASPSVPSGGETTVPAAPAEAPPLVNPSSPTEAPALQPGQAEQPQKSPAPANNAAAAASGLTAASAGATSGAAAPPSPATVLPKGAAPDGVTAGAGVTTSSTPSTTAEAANTGAAATPSTAVPLVEKPGAAKPTAEPAGEVHSEHVPLEIGCRIYIYWPLDYTYYVATVRRRNDADKLHFIEYEADGVTEWIDLSQQKYKLCNRVMG